MAVTLPDPDDAPGADVVLYDGHCRFCIGQVRNIRRVDLTGRLAFLSLHDPRAGERYPDLSHDQLMAQMYVIDGRGRRHGGPSALRYLTRRLPLLWPVAPLLHIPFSLPLWNYLYQQVARRRYWFGRVETCDDGACQVHFAKRK